ncbi:MAG: ABC transporter substrate-binding protein [Pseudomonadota bacterium]
MFTRKIVALTLMASSALLGTAAAHAQESITVASWGGVYQDAERAAFFEPAAKALGIAIKEETLSGIVDVRLQVQSGAVTWDIAELGSSDCAQGAKEGLFETLDFNVIDKDGFVPGTFSDHWVGSMFYSVVLAWNKAKFGDNPPKNWADFWDVAKFPGTRSLYNSPGGTLELALLADGAAKDKLYPIDVERAFKKMEEIKPAITVWWTSGAQTTQLLKDREVDMIGIWVSRAIAAQKAGADVGFTFDQGELDYGCFVIPKGSKKKDLAMKALAQFTSPELQANIPQHIDYGPINAKAFDTGKIAQDKLPGLNSSPENTGKQFVYDAIWWGDNSGELQERWDDFLTQK